VVNKRLKPSPDNKNLFPLYIRIIFGGKNAEFRSVVRYYLHARVDEKYQWSMKGALRKENQLYVSENRLEGISPYLATEISNIEKTFVYFLNRNINLIDTGDPANIVHSSITLLPEILSDYYNFEFMSELARNPRYSPFTKIITKSIKHFDLVINTLDEFGNQELKAFLGRFRTKAAVIMALKEIKPHLYVIDFLIDKEAVTNIILTHAQLKDDHFKSLINDLTIATQRNYSAIGFNFSE